MSRRRRLGSMAVVMVTIMLVVLLLFFSLTAGIQHYQMSSTLDNRARARDLAETAIHLTLAQLCKTPTWSGTIDVPTQGRFSDGEGHLSFQASVAHGWHIPNSTNNLQGLTSLAGDGRTVPRSSARLVAIGIFGGQQIQIDTIYARPPWPTGLAAQGPTTLEAVQLWGQPPDQVPAQPPIPNPWEPANVLTNRSGLSALTIEPDCNIYGNAVACGSVDVQPGAQVRGEVHSYAAPRTLPHFDIPAMWTRLAEDRGICPFIPGEKLETFVVVDGPLTVASDVEMNGGILAVNGDLTIAGKLSGSGFVLVTGNLVAGAGTDLVAQDRLALLVHKDLTLNGADQNYFLSGLVYAKGKIDCHDLTVHGAMIQDDDSKSRTVLLRRSNVIRDIVGVTGTVGLPFPFQIQDDHPIPILGIGSSRGEHFELHLQSIPDPSDNTKRLIIGQAGTGDNETQGKQVKWPPIGDDRAWTLTFDPPNAILRYSHGGFVNGRVPVAGVVKPYDGSRAQCLALLKDLLETQRAGNWGRKVSNPSTANPLNQTNGERVTIYVDQVLSGTGQAINLDLNSLLPPVEISKFQTWRESSPSR